MRSRGAHGAAERQGSWEQLWEEKDKMSPAWPGPGLGESQGIRSLGVGLKQSDPTE